MGPADDDAPTLFDDFDGLEFAEKVDFYAHEANWSNRMILGDSRTPDRVSWFMHGRAGL